MSDLIKEYEILREEIAENSRLVAAVFIANTGATAAIVAAGIGMSSKDGMIFLAPLLILIPSLFFVASQLESTTRISQYLRIMVEPKIGIRWQTNWFELRRNGYMTRKIKYVPAVSGLYGALSVVCLFLAYNYWSVDFWIFYVIAAVVIIPLILAVAMVRNAFSMGYREDCAAAWQKLKNEQEGSDKG